MYHHDIHLISIKVFKFEEKIWPPPPTQNILHTSPSNLVGNVVLDISQNITYCYCII